MIMMRPQAGSVIPEWNGLATAAVSVTILLNLLVVGYTIIFDTCGLDLLTVIYKLDAFALHNRNDFFCQSLQKLL